jgi:rSAM/selenodomain-associated transferase 2
MTGNLTKNDKSELPSRYRTISIIVPMLNEIALLADLMAHMQYWQWKGCEVILVDGGSHDGSVYEAEVAGFTVIRSSRGRARQMNMGAERASGSVLVFLHADTRLPEHADQQILKALETRHWGRFDVCLTGEATMLFVIAFFMNLRSRFTGIATGDQALFLDKTTFQELGGFPDQPLMEDIELSKRLKQLGYRPYCLKDCVITSGRRWLNGGVWRTIWLMWCLRWAYWRGVSAERLARKYR